MQIDHTTGTPAGREAGEQLLPWYAIYVRSNSEQTVSAGLRGKGYQEYLPLYQKRSRQRASDLIDLPLFPGYLFCRIDLTRRLPVLTTPGVVRIVGFGSTFVPIPEHEIDAVQRIIRSGRPAIPFPFLPEGERVRIHHGSFDGVEGVLTHVKNEYRVVISIQLLQRSVAVEVDREWIEPVPARHCPQATTVRLQVKQNQLVAEIV